MEIRLSDAGKRFNREWIFRHAAVTFSSSSYAITGPNGSGKSTLLQTIGGMLQPSEGNITFIKNGQEVEAGQAYRHISFCAPYLELIEEMTLTEFLRFHSQFKAFIQGIDSTKIIGIIGLSGAATKQIRYYSSGMKQRVKLAQAVFSDTDIVLLDEPCSNLDTTGIELYNSLIDTYCRNRLVIVCSNDKSEYHFCREIISMAAFKQ